MKRLYRIKFGHFRIGNDGEKYTVHTAQVNVIAVGIAEAVQAAIANAPKEEIDPEDIGEPQPAHVLSVEMWDPSPIVNA